MQQKNNNNNDQYVNNRQMKRYTIFVGNPGVGKSTLLNGLAGKIVFKSGVSFVGGLTEHLQLEDIDNDRVLGDTPGLSDINKRKQAAKEIEKALRKNGFYRIVFVITLESGRVKPDDATTIRLVLESISTNVPFAILINKLPESTYNKIKSNKQIQQGIVTPILASNKRATSHFHAVKFENELNDQDNSVAPPQTVDNLKKFLETVTFAKLMSNQVSDIKLDDFDKIRQDYDQKISKLQTDNKVLKSEFTKIEKEAKEKANNFKKETEELDTKSKQEIEEQKKQQQLELQREKQEKERLAEVKRKQEQQIAAKQASLQHAIHHPPPPPPPKKGHCIIF